MALQPLGVPAEIEALAVACAAVPASSRCLLLVSRVPAGFRVASAPLA